jgi:hypothetical protein
MFNFLKDITKNNVFEKIQNFKNKRYLYNHILTPNPKTCYCRIPKNACTLIRYGIAAKFKLIDTDKPLEAITWVNKNTEYLVKKFKDSEKIKAPNQFVILRNPFERILSSFLDRVVNRKDKIDHLLKKKNIVLNGMVNFEKFVEDILPHIYTENPHFVPQYLFMRKKIRYNYIIDIKNLNKMIKSGQFYDLLNIDEYQTDILSKHTNSIKLNMNFKNAYKMPLKEIKYLNKHYISIYEKCFSNDKINKIIQNLYKKDYQIYNLTKNQNF